MGVLSLGLLAPLVDGESWPATHDNNFRYFWLTEHFLEALRAGIGYPRWLPDALGGYGSPLFVFYQPGFFYVAATALALVGHPLFAMIGTLWLFFALGGMGAYLLARRFGPPAPAFFCALLFLATPYLYVDLHVRGDVTELAAILLTPWPLVGLASLARRAGEPRRRQLPALALTVAALAAIPVVHPAIGLFYYPCFVVLGATLAVQSQRPRALGGATLVALLLALCVTAPYWVTFLYMRQHVMFDALHGGYFTASHHVVQPLQLLGGSWGYGASVRGAGDGMSFQLGLVHAGAAVAGLVLGWREPLLRAAAVLYAALVAAMTPLAAVAWDHLPIVSMIQFPWRLLGVTACLQLLLSCGLLRARRAAVLVAGAVALAWTWTPDAIAPNPERFARADELIRAHAATRRHTFHTYSEPTSDALLARTATDLRRAGPRGERPLVTLEGARTATSLGDSPHRIRVAVGAGPPTTATIHQMYLPGWVVEIGGRRLDDAELRAGLTPFGTMRIAVPAGATRIRARYGGPPHAGPVNATAAVLALLLLAMWARSAPRGTTSEAPAR